MNNVLDRIIGVGEASKLWGLSPGYIKNLCAENKVKAKKIGRTWVIDKEQDNLKIDKRGQDEMMERKIEIIFDGDAVKEINNYNISTEEMEEVLWKILKAQSKGAYHERIYGRKP